MQSNFPPQSKYKFSCGAKLLHMKIFVPRTISAGRLRQISCMGRCLRCYSHLIKMVLVLPKWWKYIRPFLKFRLKVAIKLLKNERGFLVSANLKVFIKSKVAAEKLSFCNQSMLAPESRTCIKIWKYTNLSWAKSAFEFQQLSEPSHFSFVLLMCWSIFSHHGALKIWEIVKIGVEV